MLLVGQSALLGPGMNQTERTKRKTFLKRVYVTLFPQNKNPFKINFHFILLKKSRLFWYKMTRYPSLAAFTGLGLTQFHVWSNESSVLGPAGQSQSGKLSAHTFLTDTILAPGSQPDSSQLLWDIRAVNIGSHVRSWATHSEHWSLSAHRGETRDGRRVVTVLVSSSPHLRTVERHHCLSPTLIPV